MDSQRSLDANCDLSHGERDYLRHHGIDNHKFNQMSPREQHEWKQETKDMQYEKSMQEINSVQPKKYIY